MAEELMHDDRTNQITLDCHQINLTSLDAISRQQPGSTHATHELHELHELQFKEAEAFEPSVHSEQNMLSDRDERRRGSEVSLFRFTATSKTRWPDSSSVFI